MNNLKETFGLTELENEMLSKIIACYDENDNVCYQSELTPSQKGIIGSLVKKGLVYDSFENEEGDSNFFPSSNVLKFIGIDY